MVPFNLQLDLANKLTTLSAEQLDQIADTEGFMRYQIRAFNDISIVYVNIEDEPLSPEEIIAYSLDEVFSLEDVRAIAVAIRQHNSNRKLNFDQTAFDF